jgi:predicted ATP-grasp superfamily ATP-dependent carboligase
MRDGAIESVSWSNADAPRGPTLIVAFKGWNDAGSAASAAVSYLGRASDRRLIAEIDPESFFDFQSHRPSISVVDGGVRHVEWPRNVFYEASLSGLTSGVLLMEGEEPSMRWQTFCDAIVHIAHECDVENAVLLGALLADVPHTRPSTINAIATDPEMIEGLGFREANYEGPTGITGVVQRALAAGGLRACSLWAAVPHYVAATPNPPAALSLVRAFEAVTGAVVDVAELEASADRFKDQVTAAVAQDDEISGYVRTLEENADEEDAAFGGSQIPSGDAIAQEIQRYLRKQDSGS